MASNNQGSRLGAGLLTVMEVASFLAVSRSKVYMLMESGELPHVKLGGSRRVPLEAVEKLVERNTIGG